ncbi:hypothetical protein OCU04_007767 [Sclerotinia nivalis]|uniref:Uncharacterized protein n=1 Tax=Sclerotinia nivalis TaxID=352851 RepID=A0A9X0DJG7_9HELO|nr:hypothetical protein OCU04_007767 [Sclerotinia nivalis]
MQFLDGIDISDAEAIRRVVRAATLPPIGESSGYSAKSRLDTSTGPLTPVERRAVDDVEKLWMLGKETRKNIKRLVQDCDLLLDHLVVKAAKVVRKNCDYLRAHGYNEHIQDLEMVDANEPDTMSDTTTTTSKKRSAHSQENSKNTPTKKQNFGNQEKDKRDTPLDGPVPAKMDVGKKFYRKKNKHQEQLQSDTIDRFVNDNREEQIVDKTGLGSNESDLFSGPNATLNDSGKSIMPNSLSQLIKELAAYNSPGRIEFEDTGKQARRRSARQQSGQKMSSGFDTSNYDNQGEQMVNKNIQKAQDAPGYVAMQNEQTVDGDNDVEMEHAPGPGTKELGRNGPMESSDDGVETT